MNLFTEKMFVRSLFISGIIAALITCTALSELTGRGPELYCRVSVEPSGARFYECFRLAGDVKDGKELFPLTFNLRQDIRGWQQYGMI